MIPRRRIHITKGEFFIAARMALNKNKGSLPSIADWEREFAHFIGARYAIAVNSGRSGMELILGVLEFKRGDEIIIPAYTLKDLIGVITSVGLVPVPADINLETFNIDPDSIARKITDKTRAILTAHLFGTPCQIGKISEIVKGKSIFVIEDCAHSVGAEYDGRQTGSFGKAAFFSFETIKPINTYGGGMVVTNDEKLAGKMRHLVVRCKDRTDKILLRKIISAYFENWFLPTPLFFPFLYLLASPQWNKKMYSFYRRTQKLSAPAPLEKTSVRDEISNMVMRFTDFQVFIGLEKLKILKKKIAARQLQAGLFKSLLSNKIKSQFIKERVSPNYYFFVALLPANTWKARKFLLRNGIDAGIGAEITDDCASILKREDCPNAKEVFQRAIQLPLHEGMSSEHIRHIAKVLGNYLNEDTSNRSAV